MSQTKAVRMQSGSAYVFAVAPQSQRVQNLEKGLLKVVGAKGVFLKYLQWIPTGKQTQDCTAFGTQWNQDAIMILKVVSAIVVEG